MEIIRIKGIAITLDGRDYVLPPASLATLEQMAGKLDQLQARWASSAGGANFGDLSVIVDLVHACLRRNYPDITREFIAEHLGIERDLGELLQICFDGGGALRRKYLGRGDQASGEAVPLGE